jgi:hypothetical protein
MTDTLTKVKKTRTPRNEESIFKAALGLELAKRVKLKNELENSITDEVAMMKTAAAQAEQIANGTK